MSGKLIDALEAAWELDPVRLDKKLWQALDELPNKCYNEPGFQEKVEDVSNEFSKTLILCEVSRTEN